MFIPLFNMRVFQREKQDFEQQVANRESPLPPDWIMKLEGQLLDVKVDNL